jgi:hypothetical protein
VVNLVKVSHRQTKQPEEIFSDLLAEAKADPNILGFWLGGSRGKGVSTRFSDWDIEFVVKDEVLEKYKKKYPRYKYPQMELLLNSLAGFKSWALWGAKDQGYRYNFAKINALVDKTGDI